MKNYTFEHDLLISNMELTIIRIRKPNHKFEIRNYMSNSYSNIEFRIYNFPYKLRTSKHALDPFNCHQQPSKWCPLQHPRECAFSFQPLAIPATQHTLQNIIERQKTRKKTLNNVVCLLTHNFQLYPIAFAIAFHIRCYTRIIAGLISMHILQY